MIRFVMTDMIPILAFLIGALTIFIPVIIAKAKHAYFGGLVWPFINDLSRDYPSSALFATGINLLTLLLSLTWFLNYRRHERSLQLGLMDEKEVRWFKTLSNTCNFLGIFGACFLPIYQTTRGSRNVIGTIFFVFEACACIINSYLSYRDCLLKREELETGVFVTIKYAPRSVAVEKLISLRKAKRAFVMELACTALFLVSALVYLPIMYEVEPARRVTIEECISMGLGDHYCNDIVRYNETETILWNYDLDFAGYQVRAFAQLTCILTLLTYTLSFVVNSDIEETKNNERDHMYHSAVSRNTPLLGSPRDEQDDYPSSGRRRRSRSRPTSPSKPVSSPRIRSPSNSPTKREQRRSVTSPRSTTSSTHTNSSSTNRPKHYISV